MESRMLTTAMLTKIADLRGRRKAATHPSPPIASPSPHPNHPAHPSLHLSPRHPHPSHPTQVAFFIATNRLAALDAAVTRPGRFDLQLFVGTPNLPARMGRFRARLASALEASGGGAGGDGEVLAAAFEAVLHRRWVESARYISNVLLLIVKYYYEYVERSHLATPSTRLTSPTPYLQDPPYILIPPGT